MGKFTVGNSPSTQEHVANSWNYNADVMIPRKVSSIDILSLESLQIEM